MVTVVQGVGVLVMVAVVWEVEEIYHQQAILIHISSFLTFSLTLLQTTISPE